MALVNKKWDNLLRLFFENPAESFTVRGAAKSTGIPPSTIQRYLTLLRKKGLINADNRAENSQYARFVKAGWMIERLYSSGLVGFLEQAFAPSVIVVFGSVRKGEYNAESDIDLFIESTRMAKVKLSSYEKVLSHKVQLLVKKDIRDLQKPLLNNVVNGIKLSGYLKV